MVIRSATALRNDYDGMVKLSQERQEPIFVTRKTERWYFSPSNCGKSGRRS